MKINEIQLAAVISLFKFSLLNNRRHFILAEFHKVKVEKEDTKVYLSFESSKLIHYYLVKQRTILLIDKSVKQALL